MKLSREDIRRDAHCPECHARAGEPCRFTGKGAAKRARLGMNHFARMQVAQGVGESDHVVLIEDDE